MEDSKLNNTTASGTGKTPGSSTTGNTTGGPVVPGAVKTSTTATPIPPVKEEKEEMVSVPKSLIDSILKKQEQQDKDREEDRRKMDMLEYAADKNRTGIWEARNAKGELIRTFNVGFWKIADQEKGEINSYIVRGTKLIFQDVAIEDNNGVRRLIEKQTLRVFLDQGPDAKKFLEIDMPYVHFYQNVERRRFPSIKSSSSEDGEFRTIRFEDGREIEFDINFLNY